jgi:hypothetical protein
VQIFLTLISLPILIGWGLPLSLIAPLGNLLFSPILGVYLACALIVFFTELGKIPNSIVLWFLEQVSGIWLWCLQRLESSVQIGFARPHAFFLCIIPLMACATVWYFRRRAPYICLLWLSVLLSVLCITLYATQQSSITCTVDRDGTPITCIIRNGTVAVVDADGALSRKASADEWIIYHLIPAITAYTGATQIDHCMIVHPRQRTFEAITALCARMKIGTVYVPYWEGRIKRNAWRAYCAMREAVAAVQGSVVVCRKKVSVQFADGSELEYAPTDTRKTYHESTYPVFTVNKD